MRTQTYWAAEVSMPLWTKKKGGKGPEISKEISNLQVAKEEQNTHSRQILARQPGNGTQGT